MIYFTRFHSLKSIPGPWFPASSSLWMRWQRWQGKLSFTADDLLAKYGPVVRIAPNMVLVNDSKALTEVFTRRDLDTAPKAIHEKARERRSPVMTATTTRNLRYWQPIFESNIADMMTDLAESKGQKSEDIVHHLRINTLLNSQAVMGGSHIKLDPSTFPKTVGEYNFLVVWRLCLPEWAFKWLKYSPFPNAGYRVRSSDLLFNLGRDLCQQAATADPEHHDEAPTVYDLFTKTTEKTGGIKWTQGEISAEMAGQILAAIEKTSSALAFIFYELAKNQSLMEELHNEIRGMDGYFDIESLKLLDACIKEGLRFRPPVAFTGSRLSPKGGVNILGYYIPENTVITTQSLSMSRQCPDLFPNCDVYDPKRWLDESKLDERRKMTAPFGVGSRRCPGGNMAICQMRLLIAATVRDFHVLLAPETTPASMEPFEANGFRSRYDECHFIFKPRGSSEMRELI
ncbi:cytochrome P450 monooxygenase-like protein [Cadophora sp. MPI-SDFR-AT-0126]|nr:cytochrome P450 monooxygenase-like protein [Leotiomycetes sp. MPI-SDFR-AT-0126]